MLTSNDDDSSRPRYTDYTYREFSTYIERGGRIDKHKKSDRNFPALLHIMLSDEQYSHIISWMPHGRAWKIIDKELLMEEAAPKFFGQSKYASFARQLSGWGFKRLHKAGPDFGCYYHECFLRGHPRLTVLMKRLSPGEGRGTPNIYAEPDFYTIAKNYPLEKSASVPSKEKIEDSEYEDKVGSHAAKQAEVVAANIESVSTHHWDPNDQRNTAYPTLEAAAVDRYGCHTPFSKCSSQSHSFEPVPLDRGDDTKAKEEKVQEQEAMKYDPSSVLPSDYPMRQAHHEAVTNHYHGSLAAAGCYYYTKPSHSYLHDSHDYWFNNPYYSNHSAQAQGVVHEDALNLKPQDASMAQPQYPAPAVHDCNSIFPLPEFTPLKSIFDDNEDEEDQDYKPLA